jgi:hypothetical protein
VDGLVADSPVAAQSKNENKNKLTNKQLTVDKKIKMKSGRSTFAKAMVVENYGG